MTFVVGEPVSVNGSGGGEVLKVGRASGEPNRAKRVVAGRQMWYCTVAPATIPIWHVPALLIEPNCTDDDKTSRLAHRQKICEF